MAAAAAPAARPLAAAQPWVPPCHISNPYSSIHVKPHSQGHTGGNRMLLQFLCQGPLHWEAPHQCSPHGQRGATLRPAPLPPAAPFAQTRMASKYCHLRVATGAPPEDNHTLAALAAMAAPTALGAATRATTLA